MSEAAEPVIAAPEVANTSEAVSEVKPEENGASKQQVTDDKPAPRRDDRPDAKTLREMQIERRNTYMNSTKNVRTDYASLPETDDPDEIRKQVEFYFSDSNLYYDDHMRQQVLGNREDRYGENHSVSIKEIHSFKRMKRFQPYSAVVAALKESKTLDVVGDKEDLVRRKTPLEKPVDQDGEFGDPTIPRAIYAKGFGEEGKTTQFDIEAFFTPYGPLNSVRLRRSFPDRIFKGSVFIEFESEELQKEFLAIDPKPKFEGQELLIKSKREYCDEKLEDIKAGKIKANKKSLGYKGYYQNFDHRHHDNSNGHRGGHHKNHRGGHRGGRGGGGGGRRSGGGDRDRRDRDDWRGRRDDFQRNGRRGGRDRDDDDDNDAPLKKKSEDQPSEAPAAAPAAAAVTSDETVSKKRERDEDAGETTAAGGSEAKKAKADEAAAS